jgi:hypothetical protein
MNSTPVLFTLDCIHSLASSPSSKPKHLRTIEQHWRPPPVNSLPQLRQWLRKSTKLWHLRLRSWCSRSQAAQVLNQPTRSRRRKHREGCNMLECKDPSSSPSGLIYQSPSPRRSFSSRIIPTTMQWSRGFWSTMS